MSNLGDLLRERELRRGIPAVDSQQSSHAFSELGHFRSESPALVVSNNPWKPKRDDNVVVVVNADVSLTK